MFRSRNCLELLKRNHLAGQLWAVIVPHCGAGYGVGGGGAAQRAEAAKGNEYFICRLLVLTIDGKQGYPAAQLARPADSGSFKEFHYLFGIRMQLEKCVLS